MRLQELKNTDALKVDEVATKFVTVFLESFFYKLEGKWEWDMETDAVFCSDVMLSLPGFTGTRAIFHPDDVEDIKAAVENNSPGQLRFRIITTYGKVQVLKGKNIV